MILEAQCIMSTFLVDMVDLLVQGPVDAASQGRDHWDLLSTSSFVKNISDYTAPIPRRFAFRAAPAGYLQVLRNTLSSTKARHAANKSDASLLQTDPAYTRQTLATLELRGKLSSNDDKRDAMTPMLLSSLSRQIGWGVLEETTRIVLQDFEAENASVTPNPELRLMCAAGLLVLEKAFKSEFCSVLVRTRVRSELMEFPGHPFGPQLKNRSSSSKSPKVGGSLALWALDHMGIHDMPITPIPEHYLALLEYDLASQTREEDSNQTLYDCVSDLSALDEAIMAIKYIRPGVGWSEEDNIKAYMEGLPHKDDLAYTDYIDRENFNHRDTLWPPLKSFLATSIPTGKANRASLAAFDASHDALEGFWKVARKIRRDLLLAIGCPPDRVEVLMAPVSAGLSTEYEVERQKERSMLVNEINRIGMWNVFARESSANMTIEAAANRKPMLQLQCPITPKRTPPHDFNNDLITHESLPSRPRMKSLTSPGASPQSHGKVKIKTRPSVAVQDPTDQTDNPASPPDDDSSSAPANRISVSPTSMDVFRRMFVSFGKHSNSNLRWGEFVKAMDDAGFPATWSTGGSAVVFEDARGNGAIRLHQPHPDPSINPIMLRSFGKRMFKQFGWSIETFVEEV